MAIRSRDRKRAAAHNKVVANLRSIQGAPTKQGNVERRKPTTQEKVFFQLVRSGVPAAVAREAAGLPPLK